MVLHFHKIYKFQKYDDLKWKHSVMFSIDIYTSTHIRLSATHSEYSLIACWIPALWCWRTQITFAQLVAYLPHTLRERFYMHPHTPLKSISPLMCVLYMYCICRFTHKHTYRSSCAMSSSNAIPLRQRVFKVFTTTLYKILCGIQRTILLVVVFIELAFTQSSKCAPCRFKYTRMMITTINT